MLKPEINTKERLDAVRSIMRNKRLDFLVVPRTDIHGSEYLEDKDQLVRWLTGFSGSAGLACVGLEEACVLSDGRYTEQLAAEVDSDLFEIRHVSQEPLKNWLSERLQPGSRLAYDPYLTRKNEYRQFQHLCERSKCELAGVTPHPVSTVMQKDLKQKKTIPSVFALDLCYSGEDHAKKIARMATAIQKNKADYLLVTATDNIAWLLNIRGADIDFNPLAMSFLLLSAVGRAEWFIEPKKLPGGFSPGSNVMIHPYDDVFKRLDELSSQNKSIQLDPSLTHIGFSQKIDQAGGQVIESTDPLTLAKAIKNETERDGARRAQKRDALAMVRFLFWLDQAWPQGGIDEMVAAERLLAERRKLNLFQMPSFETVSAFGANAALPHYRSSAATNKELKEGLFYLVDSGGQYLDGTTDITRTVALGSVSQSMKERYTSVLKGHIAIAMSIFPKGTHGGQIDAFARQYLWQTGHDYDHGTGHGIGSYLCVHEGPQRISKTAGGTSMQPGMIISNEPGYYEQGQFGIRIENLVIVRHLEINGAKLPMMGFETITLCPIDKKPIITQMLNDQERSWLNHYHARVWETLSPDLDEATAFWLKEVCSPL